MKLLFDCIHCQKENEILIQSTIFKDSSRDYSPKKLYQVEYFDTHLRHWIVTARVFVSLQHFRDKFLKEDLARISKMRLLDGE